MSSIVCSQKRKRVPIETKSSVDHNVSPASFLGAARVAERWSTEEADEAATDEIT